MKIGIFWGENGNFVGKNGNFQAKLGILGGCGGAVGIFGEILWENRKFLGKLIYTGISLNPTLSLTQ